MGWDVDAAIITHTNFENAHTLLLQADYKAVFNVYNDAYNG
jgi:hypothetical protein